MSKKERGRPPAITKDVLFKLEQAFANGASDLEACGFAGICRATLYNYQQKNPEFVDRKEALKAELNLIAKNQLANSIRNGNVDDAKWHLERRCKKEYSTRQEQTGEDGGPIRSLVLTPAKHDAKDD